MPPKKAVPRPPIEIEKTNSTRSQSRNNVTSNGSSIQAANEKFNLTPEEKKFLTDLEQNIVKTAPNATTWTTEQLPKLSAILEKVLQVAADSYKPYCDSYMKQKEAKLNSSHNNNTSPSNTTGDLSTLPAAKTSPPAGTVAEFEEENKYIKNQLSQLQWAPFSIPRLCELLLSPATHHLNKDGVLRGDALQASLRRCVLVLYPFHAPAETAPSG